MDGRPTHEQSDRLTVVVHRRIRLGMEREFEVAMRGFVQFALSFPGHVAINVLRPPPGGRDWTVVDEFASPAARRAFRESSDYLEWMAALAKLTDGDPQIDELKGLEGWFTRPGDGALARPAAHKMAVATFLGVFPVATLLNLALGSTLGRLPFVLASALFNACVVVTLTWVVMPLVTRLLHRWLFPRRD